MMKRESRNDYVRTVGVETLGSLFLGALEHIFTLNKVPNILSMARAFYSLRCFQDEHRREWLRVSLSFSLPI